MQVTANNRQSLLDIAVQVFGSFEAAYILAERNGLAVTDDLTAGQVIEYHPEGIETTIVDYLSANNAQPATAITEQEQELVPYGGMGYMGIEIDFMMR